MRTFLSDIKKVRTVCFLIGNIPTSFGVQRKPSKINGVSATDNVLCISLSVGI
jgi:hypothetical protein